jgi:branched-chain amino acid transport system permease protein
VIGQYVADAISVGSLYALLALGIAMIFGILGLVNFAHGSLIMVTGFVIVEVGHPPWPVVVAVAIAVPAALALLIERAAFRPVRGASAPTMLVTSFALSYLLQALVLVAFGAQPKTTQVSQALNESVEILGVSLTWLDVVTVGAAFALLITLAGTLRFTTIGVQMRAAAEDFQMARTLGVRANRVIAVTFALSGVLAGVAALLIVARSGTASAGSGLAPLLLAFVATVLGGMGSLSGAVLGGFLLGAITIALDAGLPVELRPSRDAFLYGIVVVVLLLRPQGLIVARHMRERV